MSVEKVAPAKPNAKRGASAKKGADSVVAKKARASGMKRSRDEMAGGDSSERPATPVAPSPSAAIDPPGSPAPAAAEPSPPDLPNPVDETVVRRAVVALKRHLERQAGSKTKKDLLGDGEFLQVQFALLKIPERILPKPVHIALPHPLKPPGERQMCLIVKDNAAKAAAKQQLLEQPVQGMAKIKTIGKIRLQYKEFQARRELKSEYDLFLVDDRVVHLLPETLGKTFFKNKRQPVPIRVASTNCLAKTIRWVRDGTVLVPSFGNCWAVKMANTSMDVEQIVQNVMAGIAKAASRVPRGWKNIRNLSIKATSTVALPVYAASNEELLPLLAGEDPGEASRKAEKENIPRKKAKKSPLVASVTKPAKPTAQASPEDAPAPAAEEPAVAKAMPSAGTGKPGKKSAEQSALPAQEGAAPEPALAPSATPAVKKSAKKAAAAKAKVSVPSENTPPAIKQAAASTPVAKLSEGVSAGDEDAVQSVDKAAKRPAAKLPARSGGAKKHRK